MKMLTALLACGISFFSAAQKSDVATISELLNKKNMAQLATYCDHVITLKLPAKPELKEMAPPTALAALSAFLEENKTTGFVPSSEREVETILYMTGKFINAEGGHNATLLLKMVEKNYKITSIRIN